MNVFESKQRSSVPRHDVIQGLEVISKKYDSDMASANQRVSNAEYRARQAEKRADDAERKYINASKGNNRPILDNQEVSQLGVALVELLGSVALAAGKELFKLVKNRKSKVSKKS